MVWKLEEKLCEIAVRCIVYNSCAEWAKMGQINTHALRHRQNTTLHHSNAKMKNCSIHVCVRIVDIVAAVHFSDTVCISMPNVAEIGHTVAEVKYKNSQNVCA